MARISTPFLGFLILVLCCHASNMAKVTGYTAYTDPNQPIRVRIRDLMMRMTLQEKIGQMVQIERANASAEIMNKFFIGSVLSGGGSVPAPKATAQQWIDAVNDFQKGAMSTRLAIPMIYGIDAVHGHNNAYSATIFPHNVGLGVTRQENDFMVDPDLIRRIGSATAREVRATGIPYTFAPCVAVCRDPRWGRCYESYSEDPKIVKMMTEIISGLQGELPNNSYVSHPYIEGKKKVAACAKHYVGDGGTVKGTNENDTIVTPRVLFGIHMPPYYVSIIKGVSTIMVSSSSVNGVKMQANERITSPPHANYTYSIQAAILAGIDMVMVPFNYPEFIDGLTNLVNKNVIPMSRIDDAVSRILRVKFTLGLFENPMADNSLADMLGAQENRDIAREAVRKSLVLLKNGKPTYAGGFLPLIKEQPKILVVGTHADNLGYQCGGWTIEWQGLSGNDLTIGTTILKGIQETVDPSTQVEFIENPDPATVRFSSFSYAIVVVGEKPYAETNGDNMDLTLPDPGPSIINNTCSNIKCVVVVISGRPLVLEPYVESMDGLVAAWLPGTEGKGVAEVLFGDYGFTGKLARTWFRRVDQLPMNIGDPNYDPLFPFGFGLTTEPSVQT
ncbi:beta-glucosidase bogh3b [Quercus suber]|uniref:Beta-glucosidase bogh3b n=1 Tax=Quercus suber TaxID=58331 RepID=A0AAW0J360_QUESU